MTLNEEAGQEPSPQEINALVALFKQGRYAEIETRAREMTARFPRHGFGWKAMGTVFLQQKRYEEALAPLQKAAELSQGGDAQLRNNLGNAFAKLDRLSEAEASYRQALELNPGFGEAHHNLGNILMKLGRMPEAEASHRRALELKPDFAEAHHNLGNTLLKLERLLEAEASYRRALELKPNYAEAHCNLGDTLYKLGRLDEAEACYRRALELNPNHVEALNNLGYTLNKQGRLDEAEAIYRRALEIKPSFAEAYRNLAATLRKLGRLTEAEACMHLALKAEPDFAKSHNNLGTILQDLGKLDGALASYRRALEIQPDYAKAHNNLGTVLQGLWKFDEAVASYRRALEIQPDYAEAYNNLGTVFQGLGKLDDAVSSYHKALSFKPDYAGAYDNLLFLHGYHATLDPREYLSLARGWELACVPERDRLAARGRVFQRPPLAGRRLRVGYVSGDYRQHPVSFNIEQIFSHHDRSQIELFAYSTNGERDAVTERLQSMVEHWVPVMGMPDAAIRDRIEADGIDVLIDLSGHTANNRMGVFARRAAPVQAYYLGYFASTGLSEMDYLIGDDILTPPETDSHYSEQVWRLPRIWQIYNGKAEAPCTNWQPSQDGAVWLGSFNNLNKLTPATLALWVRVLHALPEGKLLLKTKELSNIGNRQRILDSLSGHGISPDRIELRDRSVTPDWPSHMAYYDRLDIALDPVGGMGGGITTCDALWMGVPVITLMGDRYAMRVSAAILDAVGCSGWITRSETEYLDKVVALARDVEQRKALRPAQRDRMASSSLCDARGLTVLLENTYVEMFERWLAR